MPWEIRISRCIVTYGTDYFMESGEESVLTRKAARWLRDCIPNGGAWPGSEVPSKDFAGQSFAMCEEEDLPGTLEQKATNAMPPSTIVRAAHVFRRRSSPHTAFKTTRLRTSRVDTQAPSVEDAG